MKQIRNLWHRVVGQVRHANLVAADAWETNWRIIAGDFDDTVRCRVFFVLLLPESVLLGIPGIWLGALLLE